MKLPCRRLRIGLALSGGGTKGLAHIGVIKTLERNGIPIDYIAGTSAGSIIGGLYAANKNISQLEKIVNNLNWWQIVTLFLEPTFKQGLVKGEKISKFLAKYVGDIKIEELQISFSAVTTDLNTGQPVIINKGELIPAIRSSSAVPFIFKPIMNTNNQLLGDGGLSIPVPTDIVRKMGADIVIAVNLYHDCRLDEQSSKIFPMIANSIKILIHHLADVNIQSADIVITPNVSRVKWNTILSQKDRQELIDIGAAATEEKISMIKRVLIKQKTNLFSTIIKKIKSIFRF